MMRSLSTAMWLAATLTGCVLSGDSVSSEPAEGKQSSNGLQLLEPTLRRLSPEPLSVIAPAIATDAAGDELLGYAAHCALASDQTLRVDGHRGEKRLPGALGLAPDWLHDRCDDECRRWVSACLVAHANVPGKSVPIFLRARHPAVGAEPGATEFSYQEGAFYGNLLVAADAPLEMYVCLGRSVARDILSRTLPGDIDDELDDYVSDRLCKTNDGCGVTVTGFCEHDEHAELIACDSDGGRDGAYGQCRTRPAAARAEAPEEDVAFAEVITVYLPE